MQTETYLDRAKQFLKDTALRVVPMAMVAVACHAATFSAPNNNSIQNTCSGGTSGSLSGTVVAGGAGISLSGNPSITGTGLGACGMKAVWKGTGSGPLTGAQLSANFTITPVANVAITGYSLVILINGIQQQVASCSTAATQSNSRMQPKIGITCSGAINVPGTSLNGSGTLSTYEADLSVTAISNGGGTPGFSVSVPSNASIDITTQQSTTPATVPAMTPTMMMATALMLAAAAFFFGRRRVSAANPGGPLV